MTLADRETIPRPVSGIRARQLRGAPLVLARLTWLLLTGCALLLFTAGVVAQHTVPYASIPPLAAHVVRDASGEVVLHPWGGGDVAAAGVLSGDRLLAVNGVPVSRAPGAPPPDLFDAPLGVPIELVVRTGLAEARPVTLIAGGAPLRPLAPLAIPAAAPPRVQLAIDVAVALLVTAVAALIVRRRSDDLAALLSAATLVVVFVGGLSSPVQTLYSLAPRWVPLLDRWFGVAFVCLLAFLLLFPDGRPASRASRILLAGTVAWMAAAAVITPELFPWRMPLAVELTLICLTLAAGVGAQLYRFHRVSGPVERQQTRWVVAGAGAAGLGLALHLAAGRALDGASYSASLLFATVIYPVVRLLQAALPLAIAAAILQYRLWAIDVVVRRALLYAALSACVVLGYALLLAGLSALVRAQGGALAVLMAATLVALAFEPLRTRLLRASRRLLYGERDEPYVAVQRLGAMLEAAPGAIPERIVTTVAGSLKLPYVAVELVRGNGLRAAVEVAAYRIALEAFTNAVRHAAARRCEVRLEVAVDGLHGLRITVADDGRGIGPDAPMGVGLRSMRERAEELGGSLTVAPGGDGGTIVSAWLPIAAPAEEERR